MESSNLESLKFTYVPRPGLLKITFINLLLNLVTLTIYRFWGKTNVRKHIWSCIHVNGEPLEYTGSGMELFKGFLFVFGLFILPYIILHAILQFALGDDHPVVFGIWGLFLLFIYTMFGFAIYKARKYQLTRTLWRGIRGNLSGSAMTYSLTYFGSMLAKLFSFGWATPVMNTVLQEQIINDMRFGDTAFKFKGRAGPLYPTFALCWVLMFVLLVGAAALVAFAGTWIAYNATAFEKAPGFYATLLLGGIFLFLSYTLILPMIWAIYSAKQIRTFADYTRFDGAQFKLNATAGSIIWLTVINLLLLIFTFGMAWPFIQQRVFRFVIDRLKMEGAVDVDRIVQSQLAVPTRGEGLADAFDLSAW